MENTKTITTNKNAYHEYFVVESFEAGIALTGTEIKSIRQGGVNLKDAWCSIDDGEMIIKQMHISPYEKGNIFNKDPLRVKKLLLHKRLPLAALHTPEASDDAGADDYAVLICFEVSDN